MLTRKAIWSFVLVGVFTGAAFGAPIVASLDLTDFHSLTDVIAQGIQVGDKLFDDFLFIPSGTQPTIVPNSDMIQVTGVFINGDYGLKFNGGWSAGGGQIAATSMTYSVTVLDPQMQIDGMELWTSGVGVLGTDQDGRVTIIENLLPTDPGLGYAPPLVPQIPEVYYHDGTDHVLQTSASIALRDKVWVLTGVTVNGGYLATGSAQLHEFYQTFSQIPEPATLGLLGIGGLAVLVRRRKR